MRKKNKKKQSKSFIKIKNLNITIDVVLLVAMLMLIIFGIVMISSADMYQTIYDENGVVSPLTKQIVTVALGCMIMYLMSYFDFKKYKNLKLCACFMAIVIVFLVLVMFIGSEVNGGRRWIDLGIASIQPSEFSKFAGILFVSSALTKYKNADQSFLGIGVFVFMPVVFLAGLTAIEPSLSAAIAIGIAIGFVFLLHGGSITKALPYIIIAGVAIIAFLVTKSWRMDRLSNFGSGSGGYQVEQALMAIGSGGIFGKGLGNGTQKLWYLPEVENDFIFANIGEELGFLGCFFVIVLYVIIILRCVQIANNSKDDFAYLYTLSVAFLIAFQVIINMLVSINWFPVTGITLPFISAGGSSTLVFFMMMGPIFNISRQIEMKGLLS